MQSFWNTVSKYPLFIIGTIAGVLFNAAKPLAPMLKRPVTAIALISTLIAGLTFLSLTLRAMLGLNAV